MEGRATKLRLEGPLKWTSAFCHLFSIHLSVKRLKVKYWKIAQIFMCTSARCPCTSVPIPRPYPGFIYFTNGQKCVYLFFVCLCVRIFSNFGLKFGREVDLDELNNVIKGTFSISPLSTELFTLENRAKIRIFWVWWLITLEPLGRFE